ncbi:kielin/chordin-like protein [Stylophora pistillata]|uniref:kielin/chordin-like protein n=1 Tax=Stylophora pistillata TaxID=50429 RepID=UPI000C045DE2|nr:kielin/chordin-like protein [Stylophora pistillata]
MALKFIVAVVFFSCLFSALESRSVSKGAVSRRSASCNGDEVIYHNITYPVESASCTACICSDGSVGECHYHHCDKGLACDNDGDTWAKRVNSETCYDCTCKDSSVHCDLIYCAECDGISEPVPGRCCPKCTPTVQPPTEPVFFTIPLITTRPEPEFPFPFPFGKKRDMMSRIDNNARDEKMN